MSKSTVSTLGSMTGRDSSLADSRQVRSMQCDTCKHNVKRTEGRRQETTQRDHAAETRHRHKSDRDDQSRHTTRPSNDHNGKGNPSNDHDTRSHRSNDHDGKGSRSNDHSARSHHSNDDDARSHRSNHHDARSYHSNDHDAKSHHSNKQDGKGYRSNDHDARSRHSNDDDARSQRGSHRDARSYHSNDHDGKGYRSKDHDARSHHSNDDDARSQRSNHHDARSYQSKDHDAKSHCSNDHDARSHRNNDQQDRKHHSNKHDGGRHHGKDHDAKSHGSHDHDGKNHDSNGHHGKNHHSDDHDARSHHSNDHDGKRRHRSNPDTSHRRSNHETNSHRRNGHDTTSHRSNDHDTTSHRRNDHDTTSHRSNDQDTTSHRSNDQDTRNHRNNHHNPVHQSNSHDETSQRVHPNNQHKSAERSKSHGEIIERGKMGHESTGRHYTQHDARGRDVRRGNTRQILRQEVIPKGGVALPVTTSDIAYIRGRLRMVTDPAIRGPEYTSHGHLLTLINLHGQSKGQASRTKQLSQKPSPSTETPSKIVTVLSRLEPGLVDKIENILGRMTLQPKGPRDGHKRHAAGRNPVTPTVATQPVLCGCCYDDLPNDPIQCPNGHLFCVSCLQNYAREIVYGQARPPLKCMTGDCEAPFTHSQLQRALSSTELANYDDRMQEEEILMAGLLKEIVRCPKCDFPAIPDRDLLVFNCPDCRHQSCSQCKVDWRKHAGLTCEQLHADSRSTTVRLTYEERMTQVTVRTCRHCGARFTKQSGCNHMTCRCGEEMCYICRAHVTGYGHFCGHTYEPGRGCTQCKRCNLWTDPAEDEQRAIKELEREARGQINKVKGQRVITVN